MSLPPELLLDIFRLAAATDCSRYEDASLEYKPFEPIAVRNRDWRPLRSSSKLAKFALTLVCKEWTQIAMEVVYECILVGHNTEQLIQALAANDNENGNRVRHIELSHEVDYDPFNPLPVLRVLQCCRLVENITRPCLSESGGSILSTIRLPPGIQFPVFHNLRRIDWWLPGVGPNRGFLDQLVAYAPNLNYLTLSGGSDPSFLQSIQYNLFRAHKSYPNMTTLRFELEREDVITYPPDLSLPNLTHLIVGIVNNSAADGLMFLQNHGPLIKTLSFINVDMPNYMGFLVNTQDPKIPHKIFALCPNITELHTTLRMGTLFNTKDAKDDEHATLRALQNILFKNLKCIRIGLDDTSVVPSANLSLFIIHNRISHFPALERIVLHGDTEKWKGLMCYMMLRKYTMANKSILLQFA